MKKAKTIWGIAIIMVLLLTLLCGCAETGIQPNSEVDSQPTEQNSGRAKENNTETYEESGHPAPLVIMIDSDAPSRGEVGENLSYAASFKDELVNRIGNERAMSRSQRQAYDIYDSNKIADITEFYDVQGLKIDGYELYMVVIKEMVFRFYFVPSETIEKTKRGETVDKPLQNCVYVGISRKEWYDSAQAVSDALKELGTRDGAKNTVDGMVYFENSGTVDIHAQMGDRSIMIATSGRLNDYESLRDLANQVIKTAELVEVK